MFDGFTQTQIRTSDPQVTIHLRYGGNRPPLWLFHGKPLTHVHWYLVAPRLAKDFTVVATDLWGYGDSGKPRGLADHHHYSFRRMEQDQVEVMAALGFDQFFVAGHDRGARTAYRMALDHPDFPLLSDPTKATATDYGVLNQGGVAHWWTFYISKDGRIAAIDKAVQPETSAEDMAAKLGALHVPAHHAS